MANGRILREGPFDEIWVQPAAGDAGGALGAALFIWHQLLGNPRRPQTPDGQAGSLLGPSYSEPEIQSFLDSVGADYERIEDPNALVRRVARAMADQKVVGWMQGRMEFGPRALGSRSILGDARSSEMQSVMNLKIKFRESFRPFAPSVMREHVDEYFRMRPEEDSPYMLLVAPVQASKRVASDGKSKLTGLDKLNVARSVVPAVTHVDHSARVQTVDSERHGAYYRLLREFERRTGCPVVINTSFNVRGEPIVCSPEQAYRCFMSTNMDVLVMENFILLKERQPQARQYEVGAYLAQFELD